MATRSAEPPTIVFDRPPDAERVIAILADLWGRENGVEVEIVRSYQKQEGE